MAESQRPNEPDRPAPAPAPAVGDRLVIAADGGACVAYANPIGPPIGDLARPAFEGVLIVNEEATAPADGSVAWAAPAGPAAGASPEVVFAFGEVPGEHRMAPEAPRPDEERLRLALDAAGLGLWDWDVRTGAVVWNEHHEAIFGYAPGRPARHYRDFADRIHPDDIGPLEDRLRQAMRERRDYRFEHRIVWPDGTVRWVESFGRFYYDEPGRAVRSVGILRDVTERKCAAQEIAELNRDLRRRVTEFRTLLEVIPIGIAVAEDPGCRRIWSNPALSRMLGRPSGSNISLSAPAKERPGFRMFEDGREVAPEDLPMQRAVATGREVLGVKQDALLSDGSWVSVLNHAVPLFDEAGRIRGGLYVGVDITERERTQRALREAEERWRTMAEALPNLVWTGLPDGQCDWLSSQWGRYTGIPERELLGLRWLDRVVHPDDRGRTRACWEAACADQADYDLEYRIRRRDGDYRWFKTRGVPIRDEGGRIVYWFGTCTDIEDHKRAEAALKEADRRKDEFLATLAHELRNPLAPIRNALQILRMPGADAAIVDQSVTMMERQVRHLVRLVDDLLDVSRFMRGKIALQPERVGLSQVVEHGVETARPIIDALGHELAVVLPAPPIELEGDPVRLTQVVANLLTNAAKYTEPGGRIDLVVRREGGEAVIRVRDTGIGIAPEMLPRIFEVFVQADPGVARSHGGLGIGLTLVKDLVAMHGGTVEARSDGPGRGSEFIVRLPIG